MYYHSIKSVLLHIIGSHPRKFQLNYVDALTFQEFILCKICKSYILLPSSKSKRRKELQHYINNHGQVFLYSIGKYQHFRYVMGHFHQSFNLILMRYQENMYICYVIQLQELYSDRLGISFSAKLTYSPRTYHMLKSL